MCRKLRRVRYGVGKSRRVDLLDNQSVDRTGELGCQAQHFGGRFPGLSHQRCQKRQTLERVDCGRDRIAVVGRIERTADALVELRIADRDQSRKQQAGAARADKGVGQGADGAIIRQEDAPRGQPKRIASELGNQTAGK